ncbi:BMC domain-containing protein [Clostridium septicum]|uniref:BMC domain-containing protein n=1 Tax=Clostridium septicum TaxID=1504 RepID=A0A9N7JP28_CLOSE|nr:BMC domain-containing protein [Clostridium septicum]AYE35167.1 BMC domain-containing protein [Clostridium septicum]MDU1313125.1 BMC domain-containing protein [Clostridium septicum]QAS60570.1 BMC domain-containing protein [Clostridium septicum]UEC20181.1 BMC domain-containing protein [Clostridium septicum]USS01764.1 BMC domain-containing protein [Clostridium septicum]
MDFRIIKSPSKNTKDILRRRMGGEGIKELDSADAIGLVQGKLIDMIYVADIAEKAVGVTVSDIRGTCPQHMVLLGIFGDTASVESAIKEIQLKMKEGKKVC